MNYSFGEARQVGPFMAWPQHEFKRPDGFIVILVAAYNCHGLIASESNGVAVLNDKKKKVVTDEICKHDSGYYGPTAEQLAMHDRLCKMNTKEFKSFLKATTRFREGSV